MNLHRVMHAGVSGLANRGWQEVRKSFDLLGFAPGPDMPPSQRVRRFVQRIAETASVNECHFFAGVDSNQAVSFFSRHMRTERDSIVAAADAACHGMFDFLGYRELHFGNPIDWHLDPVSGRRTPFRHWSDIDPLDAGVVGDSKVVWELNRHQWFVELGQAYRLTGDEHYARRFADCIRNWMLANHPGMGINWTSSLEVSLRLISWCWALFLFRRSSVMTPQLLSDMLAWIRAHAAHVERYLSHYYSPNTHLTGEALGLFYAGVLFPELEESQRWRRTASDILLKELDRQVLPDGVYFEQSTCYQHYTTEIYLHFRILASGNNIELPATVDENICRMLDFLLAVRAPDGSMPQIGDNDGGRLMPFVRRAPEDFRGLFAVAAALFKRKDYAWATGAAAPEAFWLLGQWTCKLLPSLKPAPPVDGMSRVYADGGYAVMRSGWNDEAHHLVFDFGPLGCPLSSGHGHADLLGIQCSAFGEPRLVDPGTGCYTANPEWRNYFRNSAAHNTVVVDDCNQARTGGCFSWRERPAARLRVWNSATHFDYVDAEHDAYDVLSDPVRHRRRVYFARPDFWVMVDDLYGKAIHDVDIRFHFAPGEVIVNGDRWVHAPGSDGRGLLLRPYSRVAMQARLTEGGSDPIRGWVSPDYGRCQESATVSYSCSARLPLRIVTLILPVEDAFVAPPAVKPVVANGSQLLEFNFNERSRTVHVDDKSIAA